MQGAIKGLTATEEGERWGGGEGVESDAEIWEDKTDGIRIGDKTQADRGFGEQQVPDNSILSILYSWDEEERRRVSGKGDDGLTETPASARSITTENEEDRDKWSNGVAADRYWWGEREKWID